MKKPLARADAARGSLFAAGIPAAGVLRRHSRVAGSGPGLKVNIINLVYPCNRLGRNLHAG